MSSSSISGTQDSASHQQMVCELQFQLQQEGKKIKKEMAELIEKFKELEEKLQKILAELEALIGNKSPSPKALMSVMNQLDQLIGGCSQLQEQIKDIESETDQLGYSDIGQALHDAMTKAKDSRNSQASIEKQVKDFEKSLKGQDKKKLSDWVESLKKLAENMVKELDAHSKPSREQIFQFVEQLEQLTSRSHKTEK